MNWFTKLNEEFEDLLVELRNTFAQNKQIFRPNYRLVNEFWTNCWLKVFPMFDDISLNNCILQCLRQTTHTLIWLWSHTEFAMLEIRCYAFVSQTQPPSEFIAFYTMKRHINSIAEHQIVVRLYSPSTLELRVLRRMNGYYSVDLWYLLW